MYNAPNYHILETIAKYDNPIIKGVSRMRNYDNQKSTFCNRIKALNDLELICKSNNYKYIIMSYSSEGIMPSNDILNIMKKYADVKLEEYNYLRFKSNNNGHSKNKKFIKEQLYILTNKTYNKSQELINYRSGVEYTLFIYFIFKITLIRLKLIKILI